jgi:polysaccharide biosynthesis transport protein
VFGLKGKPLGLTTLIKREDVKLSNVIHRSRIPGLYFLPAGPSPANPRAYLRSKRLKQILEGLKEKFDFLIIDTPL